MLLKFCLKSFSTRMIKPIKNKRSYVYAVVIAALINWSIPPIARVIEMARTLRYEPTPILVMQDKIEEKVLVSDASVLDYLNAATDVVGFIYDPEGKIECIEYGRAIFDTYQQLLVVNGRSDLADKIRVCADMKKTGGHLWIEYKDYDAVVPYQFYQTTAQGHVGVRTVWGTKIPYPTTDALTRFSGLVGILLSEEYNEKQ